MDSRILDYTALVLVVIGAINWGLVGFFKFDLVAFIFGDMSVVSRIISASRDFIFSVCSDVSELSVKSNSLRLPQWSAAACGYIYSS